MTISYPNARFASARGQRITRLIKQSEDEVFEHWDLVVSDGTLLTSLKSHLDGMCGRGPCVIHSPSKHPLWRSSLDAVRVDGSIHFLRLCGHLRLHTDPDWLGTLREAGHPDWPGHDICDGCCTHAKGIIKYLPAMWTLEEWERGKEKEKERLWW